MASTDKSQLTSLLSDEAWRDPEDLIARLREEDPVHWVEGLDAWFVSRHEDVKRLFADSRVSTDPRVYERYQPPTAQGAERWLTEMPFRSASSDPNVLGRRLVSAALTPRAVARMEGLVDGVIERFAAPLRKRHDVVDLVGEYTAPISATVISTILGVPPKGEDEMRFRRLASKSSRGISPILSPKKRLRTEQASVEIAEYILTLVRARREAPQEDLISDLVRASDTQAPATLEDIVRVISGLIAPGTGTTGNAAARALRSLLQHPRQLTLLREDRSLMPNAVEELLRFHSGLFGMPRYVLEDFELRGRSIQKGQLIVLSLMGANRDPRVFEDPDRLDLRREVRDTMTFGYGAHYCIGSNVARAELRSMLDSALEFMPPHARLLEGLVQWSERGVQSKIKVMPVDFGG